MTELEIQIDREIGNDTEQTRLNYLKYLNLGRRLEREAISATEPIFTQVDMDLAIANTRKSTASEIFADIEAVLKAAGDAQAIVERDDEDKKMLEVKEKFTDEAFFPIIAQYEDLINTVDAKHTDIIRTIREPGLAAVREKYVMVDEPTN